MHDHLDQLEKFTGRKITRLAPRLPIDYYFYAHPIISRTTRQIHRIGNGWPRSNIRWCTGIKTDALKIYHNALTYRKDCHLPINQCIGFAFDEQHRIAKHQKKKLKFQNLRYPLVEWGITEQEALRYCLRHGFTWGGLYEIFDRVSCFCCPLGGISKARKLWKYFPDLWAKMMHMEAKLAIGHIGRKFIKNYSVSDLTLRFIKESQQRKGSV